MKIAVLSDIHGNPPALEATIDHIDRWRPDVVIVNGDIVNRGPDSLTCWHIIAGRKRTHGWLVTRGNHEDYVRANLRPESGERHPLSRWTFNQCGPDIVRLFDDLPLTITLEGPDGRPVRAMHASMLGSRYGIWPDSDPTEVRGQIAPAPAVFFTGHIHHSFVRRLDHTLIMNSGSVGTICEYAGRYATYTQAEWRRGEWHGRIVQVPYDIEATESLYKHSNVIEEAGPDMRLVYQEWVTGWPILPLWYKLPDREEREAAVGTQRAITAFFQEMGLYDIVS